MTGNGNAFVRRYLEETRTWILPHAEAINPDMFREFSDLVASREQLLALIESKGAGAA